MRPKLIIYTVVLALMVGAAWHYRSVIAKNAELVTRVLELQSVNEEVSRALEVERAATRQAVEQRRAAQAALDALRDSRITDTDPEYQSWAGERIPPTERARICTALPGAAGCE